MTTTTSTQPAPAPAPSKPPPRPLHLRTIDTSSNPTSSGPSSPAPASSSSHSPPQTAPLPGRKQPSRRQSSISYLPPDSARQWSVRSPISPGLGRSVSLSGAQADGAQAARYKRRSTGSPNAAPSNPNANVPLTLAEKHADLLHFIAQKESKCLELRAQLAAHEAELLTLKRSWERIVHRDFGRAHPGAAFATPPAASASASAPSAPAGVPPTTLDGLVGVGKMLAAGLSTTGSANASQPPATPSLAARPSPFAKRAASMATPGHRSESSTSTSATTGTGTGTSTRLSQSSASSLGLSDEAGGGVVIGGEPEGLGLGLGGARAKTLRRRSGEVKAKAGSAAAQRDAEREREREREKEREREREKRNSAGMGSLAWVGSMGRKLEELREGDAFTKSQKRASILLSDVSQSIFSVLSPQTPSFHTPPLSASASPSMRRSGSGALSASASLMDDDGDDEEARGLGMALTPDSPAPKTPASALPPTSRINAPKTKPSAKAVQRAQFADDDDDDEWNW